VRLVIEYHFAFNAQMLDKERLLHQPLPDTLWDRITKFFQSVAALPCWVDKQLGTTVFGPKQNLDYWEKVFKTGKSPSGIPILTCPFDLNQMIQGPKAGGQ
jgi:hypothetical protein